MPPLSVWPCDTPFGNTQEGPDRLRSAPITVPLFRGFGIPNRSVRCRLNPASLLLLSVCFFFCHAKPIIKLAVSCVRPQLKFVLFITLRFFGLWSMEHVMVFPEYVGGKGLKSCQQDARRCRLPVGPR